MIVEKGDWESVPGEWRDNNSRWIASCHGWEKIKARVREESQHRCYECHVYTVWGDVHHRFGRGGGKRDDRITLPNGVRNLLYLCRSCHGKARIEKRHEVYPHD